MEGIQTALGNSSPGLTLFMIVVGLAIALVLLFWIFRKIAGTGGIGSGRNKQPRLAILDATHVDGKRRLVLVRRDDVEHLVMIGGASDVLIEGNIHPSTIPTQQKEQRSRRRKVRADRTATAETRDSQDIAAPAAIAGTAAAVAASQLAEPAETTHSEETAFVESVQDFSESEIHENELETVSETIAPPEFDVAPEVVETPPPSSVLEVELENALQTADQSEDPFAELETNLAAAELEIDNFADAPQQFDTEPAQMDDQPLQVDDEPPQVEIVPPQVDTPEPEIGEVQLEDQLLSSVDSEPELEPELEPEKQDKQPLSKNQNIEDEMQRLLDELANS